MTNERSSEGVRPSGQQPDAKAAFKHIVFDNPQAEALLLDQLCEAFSAPRQEFNSFDRLMEHLRGRESSTPDEAKTMRLLRKLLSSIFEPDQGVPGDLTQRVELAISLVQTWKRLLPGRKKFKPRVAVPDAGPLTEQDLADLAGTVTEEPVQEAPPNETWPSSPLARMQQHLREAFTGAELVAPSVFDIFCATTEVAVFLAKKNLAYGDSALNPLRIISTVGPIEQIRVRIDDKLSRMLRGQAGGEDPLLDLVGYYILLRVAERRHGESFGKPL